MSIIRCSVPRFEALGAAQSAARNSATKSFKLRALELKGTDEVANSSDVEASNRASELGRSPQISAIVIYKRRNTVSMYAQNQWRGAGIVSSKEMPLK
jgi:hypothetical protein